MIAGYFHPRFANPLPMVRVGLFLPRITSDWVLVDFLLDTGADTTALHPPDAIFRAGIDRAALHQPGRWPNRGSAGGVGGSSEYYRHPAFYAFQHEDEHVQTVRANLWIARPSPANDSLESLLGWDILRHFRLELDWARRRIALG